MWSWLTWQKLLHTCIWWFKMLFKIEMGQKKQCTIHQVHLYFTDKVKTFRSYLLLYLMIWNMIQKNSLIGIAEIEYFSDLCHCMVVMAYMLY